MADFAAFALTFARSRDIELELHRILNDLTREQSTFTLEGDPLFELLNEWLKNPANRGKTIATGELCQELTALAEQNNLHFPYAHKPRVLGRRLNNQKSNLEEFFEIIEKSIRGNKKAYRFVPLVKEEDSNQ